MPYKRLPKPDLLIVLTLLAGLGVLASTSVDADEALFGNSNLFNNAALSDLMDGDIRMAGNERAGLHLSVQSRSHSAHYIARHGEQLVSNTGGVHLSWKMSFK